MAAAATVVGVMLVVAMWAAGTSAWGTSVAGTSAWGTWVAAM